MSSTGVLPGNKLLCREALGSAALAGTLGEGNEPEKQVYRYATTPLVQVV
jgi:hypothetical protein